MVRTVAPFANPLAVAAVLALLLASSSAAAYHGEEGGASARADRLDLAGDVTLEAWGGFASLTYAEGARWTLLEGRILARTYEAPLRAGLLDDGAPREIRRVVHDSPRLSVTAQGHAHHVLLEAAERHHVLRLDAATAHLHVLPAGSLPPAGDAGRVDAYRAAATKSLAHDVATATSAIASILHADGAFRVRLYDAAVTLGSPGDTVTLQAGLFPRENAVRWIDLELRDARVRVDVPAGGLTHFAGERVGWTVNGTADLAGAQGRAAAGREALAATHADVHLEGVLEGLARAETGRLRVTATGDVTAFAVGAERLDLLRIAAPGATLAALLLAALVYLQPLLRYALLAPLYARFRGPEVLESGARARILAHLKEHEGASVDEVAAASGLAWSTAAYHLRVLAREGFLRATRAGRHVRFTHTDAGPRRVAVILMRHESTARLARIVAREPGLSQREIAERAGISPSTVHAQLKRLEEAGVVVGRRVARAVRYEPGARYE